MISWLLIILISFLIPFILLPPFINYLKRYNIGQWIRQEGPDLHQHKMGTPTMGGIVIIFTLILVVIIFVPPHYDILWSLIITVGFGVIGLVDDLIKYFKKRSLGLYAGQKLFFQIALALCLVYYLQKTGNLGTEIYLPFLNDRIDLGRTFLPFAVLVLVSSVNAVNLTDGLDGLATGLIFIAMVGFALIACLQSLWSIALFALIVAFSSLGFLIYNFFPAQVFLGDVGSFTLGGAIAAVALFTKGELFLLIIGGVFVVETLSVILQVTSVKLRKKTLFKMSPLHHHFELCGWKEPKITIRFWIAGVVLTLMGISSFR